jgi:hypothetical protein
LDRVLGDRRPATWETGTLAALLAAIFVTMLSIDYRPLVAWATAQPDHRRVGLRPELSRLKLLDIATVVFFAVLSLAAVVTTRHNVSDLDKYSQAISSGALGIIALGSIVFRHPFTIDYAKEEAPPEVWHTGGVQADQPGAELGVGGGVPGLRAARPGRPAERGQGPARLAELVHPDSADLPGVPVHEVVPAAGQSAAGAGGRS